MAKTNWQDPKSSEIRSTHISGLQEAVGKLEESIGLETVAGTDIPLTEVFISNDDRCRIYQAPEGKRNWLISPAPVIKKNGVVITDDFEIDYGGGAIIFNTPISESDILTADATYTKKIDDKQLEILSNKIDNLAGEGRTTQTVKGNADKIGNLSTLKTNAKSDLVNAINEVKDIIDDISLEAENVSYNNTDSGLEASNVQAAIDEVKDELDEHKADKVQHLSYAIATGTNSYAVNIDGVTSLVEGMSIKVKFQNANTGTATLNINGLGAKEIRKSNGNSVSAGNIKAGQILHLVYTGSVFQLLGEGGEYGNVTPDDVIKGVTFGTEEGLKTGTLELTGNAAAADVLSGKTFYSTNPKSKLTGSMPNRGAVNQTLTTQGGSYTIPAGYHNGSGKVTANFANLVAENIKKGVNIGGVVGTYEEPLATPGDYNIIQVSSQSISANISDGSSTSYNNAVRIKYKVNVAGTYKIVWSMTKNSTSVHCTGRLYKSGSPYGPIRIFTSGGSETTQSFTENMTLSAGDTVEIWGFMNESYQGSVTFRLSLIGQEKVLGERISL